MVLSTRFFVTNPHTKHMKHFTSILCSMLLSIVSLSAQNFELVYNGKTVADGETLNIKATIEDLTEFIPDYYIVEAKTNDKDNALNIHNLTSDELNATVKVEVLEDVEGTVYSLCSFGTCSTVSGGYATKPGVVPANGEAQTGWDVIFTYGNEGIAKTKLTVTASGQSQTVYVNFVYGDFATDIKSLTSSKNVVCKLTNGMLQIESQSVLKNYQMYSISGELVAEGALSGNNCNVNVNAQRGIYLVKVTTAEGSKTFKLFSK